MSTDFAHEARMRKLLKLSDYAQAHGLKAADLGWMNVTERNAFADKAGVNTPSDITWSSLVDGMTAWETSQRVQKAMALPDDPFAGIA